MTLKDVRRSKYISQSDAAKIVGVPLRTYKRYETEKKYVGTIKYNFILEKIKTFKKDSKHTKVGKKTNVVIAGIGYVGLATAFLFSKKCDVKLIDINKDKVKKINEKKSPIDLDEFKRAIVDSKFKATDDIYGYKNANIVFVATPTDLDPLTNRLDTFSVESVIKTVREINKRCLIAIKSTVPVGFTKRMQEQYDSNIIFVPEFLREEHALSDALNPYRIVIGCDNKNQKVEKLKNLYESSINNMVRVDFVSSSDAEAIKLFSNAYLSMRIAFFNELDSFASVNKLSTKNIINGLGKDPRIGDIYNDPSFMFGGYCLPKDLKEVEKEMDNFQNNTLIQSISISNQNRADFITNDIISKASVISKKPKENIVVGMLFDSAKTKSESRYNSSNEILKLLKEQKVKTMVYELNKESNKLPFDDFVNSCDLIVSNSNSSLMKKYKNKFYTRSIK